jgi:ABC-2 type transport system permease protein
MIQPGTAVWFARHESRLAWRDWVAMMTAGKAARRRRVALGIAAFVIGMHAVAYFVVGGFATAVIDKHFLIGVSATVLLSWLLMVSQAMESITRAFYTRADLDLILASPVAAQRLFAVRIATVALAVAAMALPLAGPFINMLAFRGGWHWLGAYGVILAMGAAATAVAVALTVALFRVTGPKRTRLTAQVLAAIIGAAFVIGLQVAAILSYGTLSRADVLQSQTLEALAPDLASVLWWPARAVLGDIPALAAVLTASVVLLAAMIALVAPRFGDYAIAASGAGASPAARPRRATSFRVASPRAALRRKEWLLLRRDPWLASQTLMQMLYLLPPAILLWRTFEAGGGALNLLVPVLVMAAGQLAGGLAWLTISGEDAADLVATAPIPQRYVLRAKIEAVIAIIAVIFAPLVAVIAVASLWHAAITGVGIVIAAACATAIQLWFRTQAKRSQFRRRQVSSRVATFAEAFSSIGWAATAAVAAVSLPLAVPPGLIALAVVVGTRLLAPRQSG